MDLPGSEAGWTGELSLADGDEIAEPKTWVCLKNCQKLVELLLSVDRCDSQEHLEHAPHGVDMFRPSHRKTAPEPKSP